ncbi:hypothetical protein L6452_18946 [Arctium lappa]|uniref:Uncharacterized protein n=1 Tax=Arctium lappa TaxID=4217 RepID=A0ACB9B8F9_ARCLA|nr:hypothetical protein L6452_18946 [Arctium lappa]
MLLSSPYSICHLVISASLRGVVGSTCYLLLRHAVVVAIFHMSLSHLCLAAGQHLRKSDDESIVWKSSLVDTQRECLARSWFFDGARLRPRLVSCVFIMDAMIFEAQLGSDSQISATFNGAGGGSRDADGSVSMHATAIQTGTDTENPKVQVTRESMFKRYLGVPLSGVRLKVADFAVLISKVHARIHN